MLELLIQYADKYGISSEPGFKTKDIKWLLVFDSFGNYIDLVEIGDVQAKNNKGREFQKCPDLSQPEMVSGSVIKSQYLTDTLDVVVMFSKEKEDIKLQKIQKKHEYFLMLLEESKSILPELEKVVLSLQNPDILSQIQRRLEDKKAKSTEKVTIQIGDNILLENTNLLAWWKEYRNIQTNTQAKQADDTIKMRCFATHELVKPIKTHPKIGGLSSVGGLSMGDALISFDKAAFQSFGLEQSENAAVSEEAAKRYSVALNHLIKKGICYPGLEFIYWFKEKVALEDDPLSFITENEEKQELNANEKVKQLLLSIQSGSKPDLRSNYYYLFLLSGASGRIMIRDWIEGQFESLVKNIDAWFEDLKIIARDGESYINSPKLFSIYASFNRELKDLLQVDQIRILRSALNNEEISLSLLAKALRFHTISVIKNEGFKEVRLALMKVYHIRKNKKEGEVNSMNVIKPEINENHPNPAYQCGRLMAVFANLQKSALGDVGAGVVQRYYASASSTPALVLGRLTRTSQYHLSKLDPGLAHWYEELIGRIWSLLSDGIPTTLTLEEQSLFALGYYQQLVSKNIKSEKGETNG